MKSSLKVSVVTACYNMGRFVEEAVGSALRQSYPIHEIVVVDDGSSDDSRERIASISDPRVRLLTANHGGASRARNLALAHVSGDVVSFLDADDRWLNTKVETEVALFSSEPDVGATFTNFRRFNDAGYYAADQFHFFPELASIPTRPAREGAGHVIVGDAFSLLIAFQEAPGWTPAATFRTCVLGGQRFVSELEPCEDLHLCFSIYRRSSVGFIDPPTVEVRRHGSNMTMDWGRIHQAAHRSMIRLLDEPLTLSQRRALNARLARSLVAFGAEAARRGEGRVAMKYYAEALSLGPRWLSFAKQLALTPYHLIRARKPSPTGE